MVQHCPNIGNGLQSKEVIDYQYRSEDEIFVHVKGYIVLQDQGERIIRLSSSYNTSNKSAGYIGLSHFQNSPTPKKKKKRKTYSPQLVVSITSLLLQVRGSGISKSLARKGLEVQKKPFITRIIPRYYDITYYQQFSSLIFHNQINNPCKHHLMYLAQRKQERKKERKKESPMA